MAGKKKSAKKTGGAGKNAPLVVVYGMDWESERGGLLRRVIRELGFGLRVVRIEQLADPVGSLAGLVGYRPAMHPFEGEGPDGEFMLLCNLNKRQMGDFLMALKVTGVSIPHKAMLTKNNRDWPFAVLMSEVAEEHERLTAAAGAATAGAATEAAAATAETAATEAAAATTEAADSATAAKVAATTESAGAVTTEGEDAVAAMTSVATEAAATEAAERG